MRRKHRIIILVSILSLVLLGGGAAVLYRQHSLNQRALQSRELGMASAEAGRFKDALHQIGAYLQRYGQNKDAEALFEYARARGKVPLPNGRHLGQAVGLLLQVLSIHPSHDRAQHELLTLYSKANYGQETLDLAREILDRDPEDSAALIAEARALVRLRRFDEALERARHITKVAPENIEGHILVLALMENTAVPEEELLAYPDAQVALDQNGTVYQVVHAVASQLAGRMDEARDWAKRAGEGIQVESSDIELVNSILISFDLYEESLNLLARVAPNSDDSELLRKYCQRLLEAGDTQEVLAQTGSQPADKMESALLAIRAMATARENNANDLESIVRELEDRSDDLVANAWAPILRVLFLNEGTSPQEVVRLAAAAIESDPANAYFHYFQGLAYQQLGETEQAIASWQNAATASRAWVEPVLKIAELLAEVGRYREAHAFAHRAYQLAPRSFNVAAMRAEIIGRNVDQLSQSGRQELLRFCEEIQKERPLEPRTLPLMAELQASQGDTAAAGEVIQSALRSQNELPESVLLKLAQTSEKYNLGLEAACFTRLNETSGMTPALAFVRAISVLRDGDPVGGKELLQAAAAEAGNTLQWEVSMAQYLEASNSEEATALWTSIAEKAKDNSMLLHRVLNSQSAWKDPDLIDRVITHLRELTGESAVTWRAARARWLLMTDTSRRSAAEAATLLNDTMRSSVPDASRYTILATALERLDNTEGAINCLERASQLSPSPTRIHLELARLHTARGNSDQAINQLTTVLESPLASDGDRRQAAVLLVRENRIQQAIDGLLKLQPEEDRDAPKDLLLAKLYRSSGQIDKAKAICERVLQEEASADAVYFTADMLASGGQIDEARAILDNLDTLEALQAGVREMLLAEFNRVYGAPEEARRWYDAAIAAANDNAIIWRRALAFLIRQDDIPQAIERFSEAAAACPEDEALTTLAGESALMHRVEDLPAALPFILACIEKPESLAAAVEALETIDGNPESDGTTLADEFRKLTERYPNFLTLKMDLVRRYASMNRHGEAADLATQAMYDFRNEIEPALLAAEAHAANGDWLAALSAAREWRRRSPGNPSLPPT